VKRLRESERVQNPIAMATEEHKSSEVLAKGTRMIPKDQAQEKV
jgi:hypothetical protein